MSSVGNNRKILIVEYAGVLAGFLLMYLFILPQMDVFLLSRYVDDTLRGAVNFSLYYGNGRLLGNIIGVYFSNHFVFATIIISVVLTAIVFLLNSILLDNSPYTVFLFALFIAFPSIRFLQEVYYAFACVANYVIPMVFLLASVYVCTQTVKTNIIRFRRQKTILFLVGSLSAAASCLFSENTTILAVVIAIAMVVYFYLGKQTGDPSYLWIQLAAIAAGTAVMFLIPIITKTSGNLSGYRQITTELTELIRNVLFSYFLFADIFNHLLLLLIVFSFAMILLLCKQKRKVPYLTNLQLGIFVAYPLLCFCLNQTDSNTPLSYVTMLKLADAALTTLYAANVIITVFLVEDKVLRLQCILMSVVVVMSVAPMMVVTASGERTYYTTFVAMTVFAVILIRQLLPEGFAKIMKTSEFRKMTTGISAGCFAMLSAVLLLLGLYNYDFYVIRCEDMAETITVGRQQGVDIVQKEPVLPFSPSSMESHSDKVLFLAFDENSRIDTETIALTAWDHYDYYRNEIVKNPFEALRFAFENWEYKDPEYPDSLILK